MIIKKYIRIEIHVEISMTSDTRLRLAEFMVEQANFFDEFF